MKQYESGDPLKGERLAIMIILQGLDIDECRCGNSRIIIKNQDDRRLEPSDIYDLVACIASLKQEN